MVRLGQGVFIKGRLNHSAIKRTLDAFSSFKKTAEKLRVQKILAFGTSALREAEDRDGFIKLIKAKVGIDIHIISGQEEANLIALGILTNEKSLPNGLFGLVDIGGGSTEISICKGDKVLFSDSFPLGTARLSASFSEIVSSARGCGRSAPPPHQEHYSTKNYCR